MPIDRRRFLKYAGASAAVVGASALGLADLLRTRNASSVTKTQTETVTQRVTETEATGISGWSASLRSAADVSGLLVGTAALPELLSDAHYASTLAREFNFLTPDNAMKWGSIDQRGFADADALVDFAAKHQMKVKGHTLIWHQALPTWVNMQMTADDLRRAVQNHISEVVGRYRGKVYAWDVVNEAVDDREGLRKTIFLEKMGEGYIAEAFRLTHEADPDALLIYNDYGAEAIGSDYYYKSDRVYALVKKLLADGTPIHGVGLQMHIDGTHYPKPEDIAANVRRLTALGLKVNISEMDVRIKNVLGDFTTKLQVQRQVYRDVIAACLKESGFMAVTFWGFTDAHYWLCCDRGPDNPLLFDEKYQPKPAYWGVLEALLGG
jgi:GH35 family endo-1,4-beta-xylanase